MTKIKFILPYIGLLLFIGIQISYFISPEELFITKVLYILITYIFSVILVQFSKNLFNVFLAISFFVSIFYYPVNIVYGKVDYGYIYSVYYTNVRESFSYMKMIPIKVYLNLILLAIITIALGKLQYKRFKNRVLYCIVLYFPIKKIILYPLNKKIYHYSNILPIKKILYIISEVYTIKEEQENININMRKPSSWEIIEKTKPLKKNIIVIIGESARRDFFHNYGFLIKNTPFIDSTPHIQFENYVSVSYGTISSLSRTLSLSNTLKDYQISDNIVSLGHKLGYETYWVSNQEFAEKIDSYLTMLANSTRHHTSLHQGKVRNMINYPMDDRMLPIFDKYFDEKTTKPKLIIVHMYGSHPAIKDRVNGEYDEFLLSKNISYYSKSIKNTDAFIDHIYKKLKDSEESYYLIYFSDHGQGIKKDLTITHTDRYKEGYNVPLLIWGDDISKSVSIQSRRTGKDFLYFFSELIGVRLKNIHRNYRFISEDKNDDSKTMVLDGNLNLQDYEKLPSNGVKDFIKNNKSNNK